MDRAFQRIRSLMLRDTFYSVPPKELNRRMAAVRKRMYMAGAHYVVNTIAELPEIIEIINHKMN